MYKQAQTISLALLDLNVNWLYLYKSITDLRRSTYSASFQTHTKIAEESLISTSSEVCEDSWYFYQSCGSRGYMDWL